MKEIKEESLKIPEAWDDSDLGDFVYHEKPKNKKSFVFILFFGSLILLILSLIFAGFSFFNNYSSFSEKKIEIYLSSAASIASGEESSLDISVINENPIPITDAYVVVSYDSGESFSGDKKIKSEKIDFGQIMPSMTVNKGVPIILFGDEGTTKDVKATLYYKISSSKAEFNKDSDILPIYLKTSPVSIAVNSLKEVRKNTYMDFTITIKNNTSNEMSNLIVAVRPPKDFSYSSSSLPLYNRNPSWIIKNLPANSKKEIVLTGKINNEVGSLHDFSFFVGVSDGNRSSTSSIYLNNNDNFNLSLDNVYSKIEKTVTIIGQYLEVYINSENSINSEYLRPGDLLILDLEYKNNLSFPIDNVVISGDIISDVVDKEGTKAINGSFSPDTNTFFWDQSSLYNLSQIGSEEVGKLRLQIRVKKDAAAGKSIRLRVYAKGERNSEESVDKDQDISIDKTWFISN